MNGRQEGLPSPLSSLPKGKEGIKSSRGRALNEAQQTLKEITARLRGVDAELAELSSSLPGPTEEFEARAELGGVIHSVQTDLLADAIATLDNAANQGIFGLYFEFQKRQQWLRRNL